MAFNKHKLTRVKLAVFGDGQVGKTAFTVRYLTKRFIGEYDSNKEMIYSHKVPTDKDEVTIEIMDTAKHDEEEMLIENIKWADGFILIYSVTSKTSIQFVEELHSLITKTMDPHPNFEIPIVLVANKVDLIFDRSVAETEGCELSKKLASPIYELSVSENGKLVNEVVEEVIRQIKREFVKLRDGSDKSVLNTMKRALKKKMYRSKSDTM